MVASRAAAASAPGGPSQVPPPAEASTFVANLSLALFWIIIAGIGAAAYLQGDQFASTKDSATVVGVFIGLAAFFAWVAVDEEPPELDEIIDGAEDDGAATPGSEDGARIKKD